MRTEAYKLTAFTAVISALGFMLRWLQDMRIIEPETGLAARGTAISVLVTALIVIVAALLAAAAIWLRRFDAPAEPEEALTGRSFVHTAAGIVPAALLAISGLVQLLQAGLDTWPESQLAVRRICGVATLAAAFGLVLVVTAASKRDKAASRRVGSGLLMLFGAVWIVTVYKSAASDPVIWRFAVEILAVCAALLAFFYVAGYFFGQPNPFMAIFFCELGAFLCVMSAIDEHALGESLCYVAVALLLFFWGFTLTANLRRTRPRPRPEAIPAEE